MKRISQNLWRSLLKVLLLAVVFVPEFAAAQERSLSEGPVVRRQLLFRSSKVEIAPALGLSLGGVYQRDVLVGAAIRYHLTNSFSAGLNVAVSPIALDTSLASNLATASPEVSREMDYSRQFGLVDAHLSYVPIGGKVNLLGNNTYYYDFYVAAGIGGALIQSDSSDLSGFKFGPALTAGIRFFVSDNIALNFRTTSYFYSSAIAQRTVIDGESGLRFPQAIEERFRAHTMGLVGISVFLPGDVRVSR
jgi:outer membrane beta-barrel protein